MSENPQGPAGLVQADAVEEPRPDEGGELRQEIEQPAKLLRIAGMVQSMLEEVRTADLDEAGRERLTEVLNSMVEALRDVVSADLRDELEDFAVEAQEGVPSASELKVLQAQLQGWLQGLFHGIQASIATQQMAAQQQLAQMRGQQGEGSRPSGGGQYL